MPLAKASLESAIKTPLATAMETEIKASFQLVAGMGDAELKKFCTAMANACASVISEAVVTEITTKAQVQAKVMSGAGSGGDVVGTVL